jgi:hypothetical protein
MTVINMNIETPDITSFINIYKVQKHIDKISE